jgi:energy-coupling factor transporter ATP-binding protein EcfA2
MLSTLHLQNFRGFSDHRLRLRPLAVVVGQNNAGKSTLIEALRTVAEILPRLSRGRWVEPTPLFRRLGVTASGVLLELPGAVRAATVFHRYGSAPAVLDAAFARLLQNTSSTAVDCRVGMNFQQLRRSVIAVAK